jgi:hypothetical protein
MKRGARVLAILSLVWAAGVLAQRTDAQTTYRFFPTPEAAVEALAEALKAGSLEDVQAIFGPESNDLVASGDPATGRRAREVFSVAFAERWRLEGVGDKRTLVIGNEQWPFPVPLVREAGGWRFDAAAGREEVLARRIGRNELAVIRACRTYVAAQRLYAESSHDGQPAGMYAAKFRSDPGRQNGLYWPAPAGGKQSPLGDLVAAAAREGRLDGDGDRPTPFHGYYFKILTAQGPSAAGGPRNYISMGGMSRGFALVAWPAHYDLTGVMTFIVNHGGVVYEKDLGIETDAVANAMSLFEPDATWNAVSGGS